MLAFAGRIIGTCVGLFAGLYGAAAGFIVGYLLDQVLAERRFKRSLRRFYRNPLERVPPYTDSATLSLIGVTIYLAYLGGSILTRHVLALTALVSGTIPAARSWRRASDRAIDEAVRNVAELNAKELALCLRAHLTESVPDEHTGMSGRHTADSVYEKKAVQDLALLVLGTGAARGNSGSTGNGARISAETICGLLGIAAEAEDGQYHEARAVLGIQPNATPDEIKSVFRTLAAQFHPDRQGGLDPHQKEVAAAAFVRIRSAYDILMSRSRPNSPGDASRRGES